MSKDKNGLPGDATADSPNPGEGRSNDEGIITESAGGVKQAPPADGPPADPAEMAAYMEQLAEEMPHYADPLRTMAKEFATAQKSLLELPPEAQAEVQAEVQAWLRTAAGRAAEVFRRLSTPEGLLAFLKDMGADAGRLTLDTYPVHTSQEWTALEHAAADGKTQADYREVNGQLVHQRQGAPFFVRMTPRQEEALDALVCMTQAADANSVFGLLYVSELLAPAAPLERGAYAGGRVNIDDVIGKIGLDPRSTKERMQMREWVYKTIVEFGARAEVVGRRTGRKGRTYTDPSGQEIDTYIAVTPWAMMNPERPVQPGLFGDVPVSVELVASREWTALTTAPATRQFLPCGEVLGSIPPRQAAGAWARVIGLAFMNFKRRHPTGRLKPTRRQLLTEFTPAKSPPLEILDSENKKKKDPGRALRYWRDALRILVERGILADMGEAAQPARQPAGYGWQKAWLDAKVELQPGALLAEPVKDRALARAEKALPPPRRKRKRKPKD